MNPGEDARAPGRFITLEGGEGAGKSTQARWLAETLQDIVGPVLLTREPGGAPGAEALRELLLSGTIDWSAQAETLLHVAARAEHVARTIRPALVEGRWVICDRFSDSTMAYQGFGLGGDRGFIEGLARAIGLQPDLTIVLDIAPERGRGRLSERGGKLDRYERLDAAFHARVATGFRAIAAAEPDRCIVVDAAQAAPSVRGAIWEALRRRLRFP